MAFLCYGPPYAQRKSIFWEEMATMVLEDNVPWIVMGDLNIILSLEEKIRGQRFSENEAKPLRDFLFTTGSFDLGCTGVFHTCSERD